MTALLVAGFTLMAIHLGLLGAWTGTVAYGLSAVGYIVVLYRGTDWRQPVVFSIATLVLGLLTWKGWVDSGLFMVGNIAAFTALATLKGLRMRVVMAAVTTMFLVAFILIGSLPGIVLEAFVLSSSLLTSLRLWHAGKTSAEPAQTAPPSCPVP